MKALSIFISDFISRPKLLYISLMIKQILQVPNRKADT